MARSRRFGGQRRRRGQPCPTCAEPFIHRKKSLPGLTQNNACKWSYFIGSVGIRICRDVFQEGGPAETSSQTLFPCKRAQSRRPDSNRGPLHYEGKTSEERASTRGHSRALFRWNACDFSVREVDARARSCPTLRTCFVPGVDMPCDGPGASPSRSTRKGIDSRVPGASTKCASRAETCVLNEWGVGYPLLGDDDAAPPQRLIPAVTLAAWTFA